MANGQNGWVFDLAFDRDRVKVLFDTGRHADSIKAVQLFHFVLDNGGHCKQAQARAACDLDHGTVSEFATDHGGQAKVVEPAVEMFPQDTHFGRQ